MIGWNEKMIYFALDFYRLKLFGVLFGYNLYHLNCFRYFYRMKNNYLGVHTVLQQTYRAVNKSSSIYILFYQNFFSQLVR